MKNRYFLEITFNGFNYHGWQVQENIVTVQGTINEHISIMLGEKVNCVGCGRTDAGVHATKYITHFDTNETLDFKFARKLNSFLPRDIAVLNFYDLKRRIHARFDALNRSYKYILSKGKNPFMLEQCTPTYEKYDISLMNQAAEIVKETPDFETFSKGHNAHNHYLCDILEARWEEREDQYIFYIKANRFVRSMIRMMVGTMIQVGRQKMTLEKLKEILEAKDRTLSGKAIAPSGLYFTGVEYPEGVLVSLKE
jgi:tRNA pseudouridine38-40 synthase